jgi:hypothetical protein
VKKAEARKPTISRDRCYLLTFLSFKESENIFYFLNFKNILKDVFCFGFKKPNSQNEFAEPKQRLKIKNRRAASIDFLSQFG